MRFAFISDGHNPSSHFASLNQTVFLRLLNFLPLVAIDYLVLIRFCIKEPIFLNWHTSCELQKTEKWCEWLFSLFSQGWSFTCARLDAWVRVGGANSFHTMEVLDIGAQFSHRNTMKTLKTYGKPFLLTYLAIYFTLPFPSSSLNIPSIRKFAKRKHGMIEKTLSWGPGVLNPTPLLGTCASLDHSLPFPGLCLFTGNVWINEYWGSCPALALC